MAKSTLFLIPYIGLVALGSMPSSDVQGRSFGHDLEFVRNALSTVASNLDVQLSPDTPVAEDVLYKRQLRREAQQWSNWGNWNNTFNRVPPKGSPS
jgi:hypothetical protein